ncbi:MAG: hypothetical protein KDA92_08370, partial [Planctomycetales bacterium]|nr:hypothetical protein [Planctomycetales bacterium]
MAAITVLFGILAGSVLHTTTRQLAHRELLKRARLITGTIATVVESVDATQYPRIVQAIGAEPEVETIVVVKQTALNDELIVIAATHNRWMGATLDDLPESLANGLRNAAGSEQAHIDMAYDDNQMQYVEPILLLDGVRPVRGAVAIRLNTRERNSSLLFQNRYLAAAIISLLAIQMLAMGNVVYRRAVQPMSQLCNLMRRHANGERMLPPLPALSHEFQLVSVGLHDMLASLENTERHLRFTQFA